MAQRVSTLLSTWWPLAWIATWASTALPAGAELAQLARLRVGELDGAVCSNSVLDAIARQGSDEDRRVVWRCAPFNHCNFTVLDDTAGAHAEFARLLLSMNAADPKLCEPMELEGVNRWVPFDPTGYASILAAVRGGPVIVG